MQLYEFGPEAAVKVESWNRDLSPWPAPAVFGNESFGDGAAALLREIHCFLAFATARSDSPAKL